MQSVMQYLALYYEKLRSTFIILHDLQKGKFYWWPELAGLLLGEQALEYLYQG